MSMLWYVLYGSYRLLARRIGRPGASLAIAGASIVAIACVLATRRAILPVTAFAALGVVWLWGPALRSGPLSRRWSVVALAIVALSLVWFVIGR